MTTLIDRYNAIVEEYDLRKFTSQMTSNNQDLVMRVNCYIVDHPEDSVKHIVEMLGHENINIARVLKWMERRYIVKNENAARVTASKIKYGTTKKTDGIKSPVIKKIMDEKKAESQKKEFEHVFGLGKIDVDPNEEDLTVQQIRKKIKNAMTLKINDAQVVSQYASALKALSGVQDDELQDDFAEKQLCNIYVPQESTDTISTEVDPIDHDF